MSYVTIMVIVLVAGLATGLPVAVTLGFTSLVGLMGLNMPLEYMAKTAYTALNSFTVIAIPMFILSGAIMESGGLTKKLVSFAREFVGGSKGGLAVITVLTCSLFAAISGSGPATTAAIGTILVPAMIHEGYDKAFAGSVAACSGGIGVVIPPSILLIMYGVAAEQSIVTLFVAGALPGVLLAIFLIVTVKIISIRRNYGAPQSDERTVGTFFRNLWNAKWALFSPVIILGGIYGGIFTVTEASIVSVLYGLFVSVVIYKKYSWAKFKANIFYMSRMTGSVLIILMFGTIFGRILTLYQVPQQVSALLINTIQSPAMLIIMINVLLLFIGMWMESITMIVILTPLLLPAMVAIGIHPIQFGVMFAIACEIGYETPPLGVNLFVASELAGTSIEKISKEAVFLAGAEIIVLMIVSFVPEVSLFLPRVLGFI
ncbi:MAG: TRAP transporter large permease [Sphaerochaetaceae bacterium]|nr:TRAP transporter large permease [Sphaerochaetaceae bacterium]